MLREPPAIEAYGGGGFRVAGRRVEGSILILDDVVETWPVARLADLAPQHFEAVLAAGPAVAEFVLLGLGPAMAPPPRTVREALAAAGLGLEVMDTPAACRLYNVLAREGRRIAAALIAV
ncbi:MAG TPA: Mth938-like domain-containing protein [Caulobacteraceae bacterium]|jgi:uncharacterized protein|nr:Mth938-like domain-containing protein [Caulobacteraceae bacterium]